MASSLCLKKIRNTVHLLTVYLDKQHAFRHQKKTKTKTNSDPACRICRTFLDTVEHGAQAYSKKMADGPVFTAGNQFPDGNCDPLLDWDTQAVICVIFCLVGMTPGTLCNRCKRSQSTFIVKNENVLIITCLLKRSGCSL